MRRRRLLSTLALVGVAGCLSAPRASDGGQSGDATESPPGTPSPPADGTPADGTPIPSDSDVSFDEEPFEMDPAPESPFAERSLGTRAGVPNPSNDRPHGVTVWNGVDRRREIRVRVVGRDVGELLDTSWAFPPHGYVALTLNWPDTYRVRCSTGGQTDRATVPQSTFDCNASGTTVGIFEAASVKQVTVSTAMACDGTPP